MNGGIAASSSSSSSSSSSASKIRTWRTAFLTLRDETLTSSPKSESKSIAQLLHSLIFSHSHSLISAAPDLPPHEVTSDLLFLMELVANSSQHVPAQDLESMFSHISCLMYEICKCQRVSLQLNSSSWTLILDSTSTLLQFFLRKPATASLVTSSASTAKPTLECIETVRHLVNIYHQKFSLSDNIQLVKFLLGIVECSHAQLVNSSYTSCNPRSAAASGKRLSKNSSLLEVLTVTFTMLGGAFIRFGSSFPVDIWQSTIELNFLIQHFLTSKVVMDFNMFCFPMENWIRSKSDSTLIVTTNLHNIINLGKNFFHQTLQPNAFLCSHAFSFSA